MILNKRYKRNIKNNLSFYISIVILTMIIVMLYLVVAGGIAGESSYLDAFKEDNSIEDAQFTVYSNLDDEQIAAYEEQYEVLIEEQNYLDEKCGDDTLRILHATKKIDQYTVTEGEDVAGDHDILLTQSYLQNNEVKIGDQIELNGKEYTITGSFVRPDYLFCVEELNGSFATPETFGLAIVSEDAYQELSENRSEDEKTYYSVIYQKDNETAFRKDLNENYKVSNYVDQKNNVRISTAEDTLDQMKMFNDQMIPAMLVFIVIIVAVVLGRKVKSEQKLIGILSALGYSKSKLAWHYSLFGSFSAIIGSVLAIVVSIPLENQMIPIMFSKIEPLPISYGLDLEKVVISLLLPLVMYTAAVFFTAMMIMRKEVVTMISGNDGAGHKVHFRMADSKWKFGTKFKIRSVFGHFVRTLVVVLGICVGSLVFIWSYGIVDSLSVYIDSAVDKIGNFEYEYYFSELRTEEPEYGEAMIATSFECEGSDTNVSVMGMDTNDYISLNLVSGGQADLSGNHYYITSMGANIYGLNAGDKLKVKNIATLEEDTIEIEGIIDNDSQNIIYTSRKNVCDKMGLPEECYNIIASDKKLDYKSGELAQTITKTALKEQIQTVNDMMGSVIYMMIPFGVVICVLVIFVMVNMLLSENASSISMLKVLGYRDREIKRIITHVYHLVVPVAAVLGLFLGMAVTRAYFIANTASFNTYVVTHLSAISVIKYMILIIVSYILSLLIANRKVDKVDMIESLKDNRE